MNTSGALFHLERQEWANSRQHTKQKFKYGKATGSFRVASGLTLAERLGPSTQSTHGSRARSRDEFVALARKNNELNIVHSLWPPCHQQGGNDPHGFLASLVPVAQSVSDRAG